MVASGGSGSDNQQRPTLGGISSQGATTVVRRTSLGGMDVSVNTAAPVTAAAPLGGVASVSSPAGRAQSQVRRLISYSPLTSPIRIGAATSTMPLTARYHKPGVPLLVSAAPPRPATLVVKAATSTTGIAGNNMAATATPATGSSSTTAASGTSTSTTNGAAPLRTTSGNQDEQKQGVDASPSTVIVREEDVLDLGDATVGNGGQVECSSSQGGGTTKVEKSLDDPDSTSSSRSIHTVPDDDVDDMPGAVKSSPRRPAPVMSPRAPAGTLAATSPGWISYLATGRGQGSSLAGSVATGRVGAPQVIAPLTARGPPVFASGCATSGPLSARARSPGPLLGNKFSSPFRSPTTGKLFVTKPPLLPAPPFSAEKKAQKSLATPHSGMSSPSTSVADEFEEDGLQGKSHPPRSTLVRTTGSSARSASAAAGPRKISSYISSSAFRGSLGSGAPTASSAGVHPMHHQHDLNVDAGRENENKAAASAAADKTGSPGRISWSELRSPESNSVKQFVSPLEMPDIDVDCVSPLQNSSSADDTENVSAGTPLTTVIPDKNLADESQTVVDETVDSTVNEDESDQRTEEKKGASSKNSEVEHKADEDGGRDLTQDDGIDGDTASSTTYRSGGGSSTGPAGTRSTSAASSAATSKSRVSHLENEGGSRNCRNIVHAGAAAKCAVTAVPARALIHAEGEKLDGALQQGEEGLPANEPHVVGVSSASAASASSTSSCAAVPVVDFFSSHSASGSSAEEAACSARSTNGSPHKASYKSPGKGVRPPAEAVHAKIQENGAALRDIMRTMAEKTEAQRNAQEHTVDEEALALSSTSSLNKAEVEADLEDRVDDHVADACSLVGLVDAKEIDLKNFSSSAIFRESGAATLLVGGVPLLSDDDCGHLPPLALSAHQDHDVKLVDEALKKMNAKEHNTGATDSTLVGVDDSTITKSSKPPASAKQTVADETPVAKGSGTSSFFSRAIGRFFPREESEKMEVPPASPGDEEVVYEEKGEDHAEPSFSGTAVEETDQMVEDGSMIFPVDELPPKKCTGDEDSPPSSSCSSASTDMIDADANIACVQTKSSAGSGSNRRPGTGLIADEGADVVANENASKTADDTNPLITATKSKSSSRPQPKSRFPAPINDPPASMTKPRSVIVTGNVSVKIPRKSDRRKTMATSALEAAAARLF
ncbi:unnamed protein product [Amoebophrya sp. A25]|nr:unnamed protein product [Amoebophrya sp. A25]|eukprot:GSA25T00016685001.1